MTNSTRQGRGSRVLILGGTAWLGSEIARAWLARGAEVTCLARGEAGAVPPGADFVQADRLEPRAYEGVAGEWDEVVELSYEPRLVASALDALAERAAHWTLVSSVSVYARNDKPDADESAELVEPRDLDQYADAKVAAEAAAAVRLGDRLLIARPGLIVGAGDPTDRFGYWVSRFARGGRVLAPVEDGRFVQVIDVLDLAEWLALAGATQTTGVCNVVGEVVPFKDFVAAVARVAEFDGEVIGVGDAGLVAHGVNYWAGPRSLPLWLPSDATGFFRRDATAFRAAGGVTRPLAETLQRTLDDERGRGLNRVRRAGLTPAEEREILAEVGRAAV